MEGDAESSKCQVIGLGQSFHSVDLIIEPDNGLSARSYIASIHFRAIIIGVSS